MTADQFITLGRLKVRLLVESPVIYRGEVDLFLFCEIESVDIDKHDCG